MCGHRPDQQRAVKVELRAGKRNSAVRQRRLFTSEGWRPQRDSEKCHWKAEGGAVIVQLALSAACGSSVPTSPTGMSPSPNGSHVLPGVTPQPSVTLPPSVLPTSFPPLSGPSRTFRFERADYQVSLYTKESHFVLYDNGAFALQVGGQYPGQYRGLFTTQENGLLQFSFESNWPSWSGTGKLEGDSLTVEYNTMMQMDDFENAVYARRP